MGADDVAAGDRVLPAGSTRFAEPRLTWAQGRTLHYGDRRFDDVVDRDVLGLLRTPSGFFLRVVSEDDPLHEYDDVVHWDGESLTEVSSAISTFEVSRTAGTPAGWSATRDGLRGGLAAVRVVDLDTGAAVVSTTEGMGDPADGADELAELYANAWPHFAGFDATAAPTGTGPPGTSPTCDCDPATGDRGAERRRAGGLPARHAVGGQSRLPGPRRRRGPPPGAVGAERRPGRPRRGGVRRRDQRGGEGLPRERPAPPVRLPTGHRFAWFHGWADRDQHRIVLLVSDRNESGVDPAVPDDTTGWIVTCDVDDATCDDGIEVTATRSVVFDDGLDGPGQG